MNELKEIILQAWEDRSLLKKDEVKEAIRKVIESVDKGSLRCAEPTTEGWQVND